MKKIIVLYHADCWDGLGGAWAAWKKFGRKATYMGINHNGDAGNTALKIKDSEIYIIDFSFSESEYPGVMKKIVTNNKKVVVLDHHISGEKATRSAHEYVYDLNHSGTMIAWTYFHPEKKAPRLLLHIEDIDIWKFKLPHTKEISAYLGLFNYELGVMGKVVRQFENAKARKKMVSVGRELLKQQNKIVKELAKNAELVQFDGYRVLAVNSPLFASELGHELSKKHPPFAVVWNEMRRIIKVSLRSNGKFNVAKLAEKFGGGGHKAAAGFGIPLGKKLPWKVIK